MTAKELLSITTQYTSSKEAVRAAFTLDEVGAVAEPHSLVSPSKGHQGREEGAKPPPASSRRDMERWQHREGN
jgi:hypothetical protein